MSLRLRLITVTALCLFILTVVFTTVTGQTQTPDRRQDRAAMYEILGLLNEWRLSLGLTPFRLDETLEAMAIYQASYLTTLKNIPNGPDIHKGRGGEGVKQRALFDQFNWQYYGRPEQIQIGEIAAVRTAAGAITFWKSSTPHRLTVTNPAYREIGIAAFRRGVGYIYVAVLGARPDVLPALADTDSGKLYLSNERSGYAAQKQPWIHTATEIRLFDAKGRPLSDDWMPWQETFDLPKNAGDKLYVLYTDGSVESLSEVDLETDVVVLPGYKPPPDFAAMLAQAAAATPLPTSTPEPPRPELLLVYDSHSLAIINNSRHSLDVSDIALQGNGMYLPMTWWQGARGVPLHLYDFPAGDCVQVWSQQEFTAPRKPAECHSVRSGRSFLENSQRFWLEGSFEVALNGAVVATCQASARRCEVDLPGSK